MRKNVFVSGAAAAVLAVFAASAVAQHQPGGTNATGYPCGNRNLLRQENVGACPIALDEHPKILAGGTTVVGVPFGDASWSSFDTNIWNWGSQSLDYQGFECSLGFTNISNPAGPVTIQMPTSHLLPAIQGAVAGGPGGAGMALIPDVGAAAIDVTAIGPFTVAAGSPCLPGNTCLLGVFFINAAVFQQPCAAALAPLPIATPQQAAPNGVSMVMEYVAGTSLATMDRWTEFKFACESYGMSGATTANAGYYDAAIPQFQADLPTGSFFHHLAFDEPTMNARKTDGILGTVDMGKGAYYLSIAQNDAIGFRNWSIEGGTDVDTGLNLGHFGLILLSITPPGMATPPFLGPNGATNYAVFGAPGENSWFTIDGTTFSFFPLFFNPGAVNTGGGEQWVPGAAGAFADVIWDNPNPIPVGGAGPAGVGATLYTTTVSLDLPNSGPGSSPTPGPRILPHNSNTIHLVP